jgi:hypothetical protein
MLDPNGGGRAVSRDRRAQPGKRVVLARRRRRDPGSGAGRDDRSGVGSPVTGLPGQDALRVRRGGGAMATSSPTGVTPKTETASPAVSAPWLAMMMFGGVPIGVLRPSNSEANESGIICFDACRVARDIRRASVSITFDRETARAMTGPEATARREGRIPATHRRPGRCQPRQGLRELPSPSRQTVVGPRRTAPAYPRGHRHLSWDRGHRNGQSRWPVSFGTAAQ